MEILDGKTYLTARIIVIPAFIRITAHISCQIAHEALPLTSGITIVPAAVIPKTANTAAIIAKLKAFESEEIARRRAFLVDRKFGSTDCKRSSSLKLLVLSEKLIICSFLKWLSADFLILSSGGLGLAFLI